MAEKVHSMMAINSRQYTSSHEMETSQKARLTSVRT